MRGDGGKGRLARTGRTLEDHRWEQAGLDRLPQHMTRAQDVVLTDELVQRPWAHPRGERLPRTRAGRLSMTGFVQGRVKERAAWLLGPSGTLRHRLRVWSRLASE